MAGSENKPTILLIGADGRPSGVPRHILHLVNALSETAKLTVVSGPDKGGYTAFNETETRHITLNGLTNRSFLRRPVAATKLLMQVLSNNDPDMIWAHARLPVLILRLLLALRLWRPACPVVFTLHGLPYGPGHNSVASALCKRIEKHLIARSPPHDLVTLTHVAVSKIARDTNAQHLAQHRLHVLPNCSDLKPLAPLRDPSVKNLIMTGRTGRQKDYHFAAHLFAQLPGHFRLNLCGPGTDDPAFQRKIKSMLRPDIFSRIIFCGPLSDIRTALQQADGYLLTSRYEGLPIGALEAFEAGLPIILRNFDGAADLVRLHACGLLIGQNSMAQDARNIVRLLSRFEKNEPTYRAAIRATWRQNWSPEIFARNATAMVTDILAQAHGQVHVQGCAHDAQALHPDHDKTAAAPVPAHQPSYTNASPSAVNG